MPAAASEPAKSKSEDEDVAAENKDETKDAPKEKEESESEEKKPLLWRKTAASKGITTQVVATTKSLRMTLVLVRSQLKEN